MCIVTIECLRLDFRELRSGRFHRTNPLFAMLSALFACLSATLATAQETETAPPPAVTVEMVETRLDAAQASTTLDEAAKTRITEIYTQTLEQLRISEEWRGKAQRFEELRTNAPGMIAGIEQELAQPPPPLPEEPAEDTPLVELEIHAGEAESELASARDALDDLVADSTGRQERRRQIPEQQANARQRLEEARAQLPTAAADSSAEFAEAQRLQNEARRLAIEQELHSYEQELLSYDARGRLLSLRTDAARRRLEQAIKVADLRRKHVQQRRQVEASEAMQIVRDPELLNRLTENGAPPPILELAKRLRDEIAESNRLRTGPEGILRKSEAAAAQLKWATETVNSLAAGFAKLETNVKVAEAGAGSNVIGALLRRHRRALPDDREIDQNVQARQREIAAIQIEQIEAEEARRELYDIDALADGAVAVVPADTPEENRIAVRETIRELYVAKRETLDARIRNYETYFEELLQLDARERQLVNDIGTYNNYINERVLWVRSGGPIGLGDLEPIADASRWLLARSHLAELAHALLRDLSTSPVRVTLCALFVLALNVSRWYLRRRIAIRAEEAMKRDCMLLRPTLGAALCTVLVSAGLPLLIALAGWRLGASIASTEYTRAVGYGLANSAFFLWSLEFFREVVRRNGLGIAHFGWSETPCRSLALKWLAFEWIAVPLFAVVAMFDAQMDDPAQAALGRLALVLLLLSGAVMGHRLFRYRNGPLLDIVERARKRSNLALRRVWYYLSTFVPMGLLFAAAAGYYYSAWHITAQLHATLTAAFCLLVFVQVVIRAMQMTRRRLARKRARNRLETMRGSSSDLDAPTPEIDIDLDRIDTQAMRLIRSGFAIGIGLCVWAIWAADLSALSVLDKVELWQVTETVTTDTPDAEGNILRDSREQIGAITLRDAAIFFFIIGITFIAVQNLPGLVEILLLQRLSLVAGERYAANMLLGYILTIIGITWAFNAIGIGWGRLQWLIAAVGLGLGFGLQEIFANLVSGIIILFERPIRVGDTVTVGDISGTVSRIRIRATWITAFNRQELIVPNKEFVTGRLVNWTLSDQVLRIEVPVGIAYGSDVELARGLMLRVALEHPLVLKDPAPAVYFQGFGDSSLDLELRVHSPDLESFLKIKDAMHTGIDSAFRAHGIEIPYPQRDIHLRSIKASLPVDLPRTPPAE